jgi:hypothetical protein
MVPVAPWHFILAVLAGWVHREQLKIIEYLKAENHALREKLGNKRLRFTDEQRRRLAVKGHALGITSTPPGSKSPRRRGRLSRGQALPPHGP